MRMPIGECPQLGFGLGLRRELVRQVIENRPPLDWLEIISDSYLAADHGTLAELELIRALYPLAMHGGALSLGGPDPLDQHYLAQIKDLAQRIQPVSISDHLCWTPPGMSHSYDLRPLPRTQEMIDHLTPRIIAVQESLGRRILVENVTDSRRHPSQHMSEWEFLGQVAEAADCLILLDLNNIITNSLAQQFAPSVYVHNLPRERICQIHLAPLINKLEYEWDADTGRMNDPIWQLYWEVTQLCGPVATLLERNDDIPPLEELIVELDQARTIAGLA